MSIVLLVESDQYGDKSFVLDGLPYLLKKISILCCSEIEYGYLDESRKKLITHHFSLQCSLANDPSHAKQIAPELG